MSTLRPLDRVPELSREELRGDSPDVLEFPDRNSDCRQNHPFCRSTLSLGGPPSSPTRVLDLRCYREGKVCLRVTDGSEDSPYMTLSHGWGVFNEPQKLLKANFKTHQGGIAVSSLPESFRDAIHVARHLSVNWLWIGSLCTVRNSEDDWTYESSLMDKVYQESLRNLATTNAPDYYGGLFPRIAPHWPREIEDAELNQRGWVVQERVLAARTLHFTRIEVFWECIENLASESVSDALSYVADPDYALIKPALPLDSKLEEDIRVAWQQLTHSYVKCLMTKATDRLIAIFGISQLIKKATGDQDFTRN
ncbi:hypothetical protein DL768_004276 [Monosporascus sp. mg162]|nr:hypothetical protein DL768_004276 [Monosporascus sp. mg162]